MKIVAGSIVRNEEKFIKFMIKSISWVNEIVILDDHSTDKTRSILEDLSMRILKPKINLVRPFFHASMIKYLPNGKRDVGHEIETRNLFLKLLFDKHNPDAVVLIDGDELMSVNLKLIIKQALSENKFDGIALTCNHVFDKDDYLHVFEDKRNNVRMIDPHVRILFERLKYRHGEWADTPDCFIKSTNKTLCLDGPYHYHLKYCVGANSENYAFNFLPSKITKEKVLQHLHKHRYPFPKDIEKYIKLFI